MTHLSFSSLFVATLLSLASVLLVIRKDFRWIPLLLVSLFFYWWISGYKVVLLVLYALLLYSMGLFLGNRRAGRTTMALFITVCLLPLLITKLLPIIPPLRDNLFFSERIEYIAASGSVAIVGISYFVFNAISYLVDIRRGYIQAERHFFLLLLYFAFYPVIYAGPLHRSKDMLNQFRTRIRFSLENGRLAFRLMLIGLFKNLVFAPRLQMMNWELEMNATGIYVVLQGLCFFFYLYFVFSSYVDIARGIGKLIGIEIADNFRNRVYASASRQQFWQGWHMTLNNWFRDYVFFPLAGRKPTKQWMRITTLVTFVLIGIWHGLSLKFACWGLLNGCWIIAEQEWREKFKNIPQRFKKTIGVIYHLSIASFLALLFSSSSVLSMVDRFFSGTSIALPENAILFQSLINVAIFIGIDWLYRLAGHEHVEVYLGKRSLIFRWSVYSILIFGLLIMGQEWEFDNYYFQF